MRPSGSLLAGGTILLLLVAAALAAPLIPQSPSAIFLEGLLQPPSQSHIMGTDALGRDVAARVAHGARVSLSVGFLAAGMSLFIGIPLGAAAGFRGGLTDAVVGRTVEAVLAIPSILFAMTLLTAAPTWLQGLPPTFRVAAVVAATGWTPVTRYLRGEFLRLRGSDVVAAARSAGAADFRIAMLHLLPAALAPVLVTASFAVAGALLLEAALSFLGLGVESSAPTWGGMLREAGSYLTTAWWLALFPGVCLFLSVLACNLTGEGLRDSLDPRARRRI